jgi:hypothetical protein
MLIKTRCLQSKNAELSESVIYSTRAQQTLPELLFPNAWNFISLSYTKYTLLTFGNFFDKASMQQK